MDTNSSVQQASGESLDAVKAQRDALLAALKECQMLADQNAERYPGDRDEAARAARVRAAIRKAGGEA